MTRVDAHVHLWRAVEGPAAFRTIVSPSTDVPAETFAQYMDEYDIARAVLVQPICAGLDNGYIAEVAARDPDRLAAVCVVDPSADDAADVLGRWAGERGCRGIRLRPGAGSALLDGPTAGALLRRAAELDTVVSLLMHAEHIPIVDRIAARFPGVRFVLDHFGLGPGGGVVTADDEAALLALAHLDNVYVKVSGHHHVTAGAYPYREVRPLFARVLDAFGAERLLWGSDFPHVLLTCGYRRSLLLQERWYDVLDDAQLADVMGGTASRLYWGAP
jgi:L-fuconolactonase